jgi:hypothetical protein
MTFLAPTSMNHFRTIWELIPKKRAILHVENAALQVENQHQKRKRAVRGTRVQTGGVLSIGEAQDQVFDRAVERQIQEEVREGGIRTIIPAPKTRAPRTCSICGSIEHTARTFLDVNFNSI